MPIAFACAVSHAPGLTAWPDAAPVEQKDRLYGAFDALRAQLDASGAEELLVLTSEHWANFFLDHIGAFCIGRAERFSGPIEPWLRIEKTSVRGDPELAKGLLDAAYEDGFEPSFAYEMQFDHGTIVPLHFLSPQGTRPVLPVVFNTLADPQPTARRCAAFGEMLGRFLARTDRRVALIATGGLSHDPGERNHGVIDSDFDRRFMAEMGAGDLERLRAYSRAELAAAGAGAFEVLAWIALAGALGGRRGEIVAYEAVRPWATGIGMMRFDLA